MYADDIVLISNTQQDLVRHNYTNSATFVKLEINVNTETKVCAFRKKELQTSILPLMTHN